MLGSAIGTIDSVGPFMRADSRELPTRPIAVQIVAEVHDTALRLSCGTLFRTFQREPLKRSINDRFRACPTAVQAVLDGHEMPENPPSPT